MKVSAQVSVVDGARRSAAYHGGLGVAWSCSPPELDMLRWMAAGRDWQEAPHLAGAERQALMRRLRDRALVEPGAPGTVDLRHRPAAADNDGNRFSHVWIELTDACNLTCGHCYSNSSPRVDRSTELDVARWTEVVRQCLALGVRTLTYIGGEPLLRLRDITTLSAVVAAESPTTRQRIFSNLAITGIAAAAAGTIRRHGMEVGTSLYGTTAAAHDAMTGRPGSWARTTDNIRTLTAAGIPLFAGYYCRSPDERKAEVGAWIESLGITDYDVLAPSAVGRGKDMDLAGKAADCGVPPDFLRYGDPTYDPAAHNCFRDHIAISTEGHVRPCIMMRDVRYGRVEPGASLAEIMAGDTAARYAALGKAAVEGCSECEFRYACFDCRPDAMAGGDDVRRKPTCGYDPRL